LRNPAIHALGIFLAGAVARVPAETPDFDRPGIAFSTTTVPRGGLAIELGVPGFVYDASRGSKSTDYRLDTNFRAGLGPVVEIELATPVYNYDRTDTGQQSASVTGVGDSSLSLKAALPSSFRRFSWALLAGATFASGAKAISDGTTQYRLATSLQERLDDTYAAGLYLQLDDAAGASGYTLSPNLGFAVAAGFYGYVEAAYSHASHNPDTSVAGAGMAWLVKPTVQLDLSFDIGLTSASPKIQGGFGVSVYLGP
jgi:hypothetical protein